MAQDSWPLDGEESLAPGLPPNPLRILFSAESWRAVFYCATSILLGLLALVSAIVGFLALPMVTWATASIERSRVALLGIPQLKPLPRTRFRWFWDPRGFGDGNFAVWGITVLFALVDLVPGLVISALALAFATTIGQVVGRLPGRGLELAMAGAGLAAVLIVGLYVAWALSAAQAHLVTVQLRPFSDLSQRVADLTLSRRQLMDVYQAERRRIERDLHDGTQQHLVLLSMQVGEAEYALANGDVQQARQAMAAAQSSVEAAMTALRETVRGIHPQLLTDRGLAAAVRELAGRQPVPVQVDVAGTSDPVAEQVAVTAYYLVSEALTNAAKHARPTSMTVRLELADPLVVEVYDDGVGGATVRPGHGLSGLFERVEAAGGRCWLSSPVGGPTRLRASLPNPEPVEPGFREPETRDAT